MPVSNFSLSCFNWSSTWKETRWLFIKMKHAPKFGLKWRTTLPTPTNSQLAQFLGVPYIPTYYSLLNNSIPGAPSPTSK